METNKQTVIVIPDTTCLSYVIQEQTTIHDF